MRVLLQAPTEEACAVLNALLAGTRYYSDDAEGSEDVCYMVEDEWGEVVRHWITSAQASGLLTATVVLLDEEEDEQPADSQHERKEPEHETGV